ncbi:UDP-N-acetylmuramoyl-L-alanyl-D-glutamate--2,6-diaminopimelate ligase [Rhodoplanes sp. Z2-YC6860]|uniref:UDP-N-acetylmuramoyl-L-alanyl-D-glutamate--2, 6-diaminopimelate ligase n=1 Tax=Rhodoplanes sp. Z2-YC6860 TaxID=674703 RepID=UPI00078EC9F7|nr:UDP-N-acetylmuramoyl-L-alanyl-D-glutamate--2,6-diaminopimelate ligase [Rhodoplanes sp. Z2-YC6860]AMN44260.1 UDP-N-acetylmuramoyl-L-alanyl-D-glutamate-2,6-diaminopimelate ligase [Rhodoplanes sp. Z2-YC6860]
MKLSELLTDQAPLDARTAALEIGGVTADSRAVKRGDLFVAVPGTKADGMGFAALAAQAGAAAIVGERAPQAPLPNGAAFVQVANARKALSIAAAHFYRKQPKVIAAVTGTSGKTSVAAFTRQIWAALGYEAASLGTIGVVTPKKEIYGSLTTPDPVGLHKTLAELADEGVTHLVMEASSHGLDQHRLDGVRVAAAGFTNLSRDHLDYHPSVEAYLAAKLRLFEALVVDGGGAVIDVDHEHSDTVVAAAKKRGLKLMTVGRKGDGIRLVETAIDGFAQRLTLAHAGKTYSLKLPLVGGFQVENALVSAGLVIATGGEPGAVFATLSELKGAKGRLDLVGERNGAPIFVDYAHKPDALEKALAALRPYVKRKLVVVFGAGGNRDAGKRPIMGAIAAQNADRVIITDDNPRNEKPETIRAAILAAVPGATEIGDRREAIRTSIATLEPGDVLLIAGKGHESGQIIGDRVLEFSDHHEVEAALQEKVV